MLAALSACASPPPLLNSERIERRFGSYEVRVLEANDTQRVSSLSSRHDGRNVTRTLAIVTFLPDPNGRVANEHARIASGGSIGAVFRASGWTIAKSPMYVGTLTVSTDVVGELMNVSLPADLAVHAYRFDVARDGAAVSYAAIVELHHPAYLGQDDLERIYGTGPRVNGVDRAALMHRIGDSLSGLSPDLVP